MKPTFEDKAGYAILGAIFAAPILVVLAVVGLFVRVSAPSPVDRLVVEAAAPDGRAVVRVMRHDNGLGFGLGAEWGVVHVDREDRWFGRKVETIAEFDCDRLEDRAVHAEWRDARHAVVRLPPGRHIRRLTAPAEGIEVEIVSAE